MQRCYRAGWSPGEKEGEKVMFLGRSVIEAGEWEPTSWAEAAGRPGSCPVDTESASPTWPNIVLICS